MRKWKKLLQNKTASQKWLKNESKMRDFRTWVKFGGAEIEASYWSRAENRGLWLVEIRWFRKFKPSAFRSEIPFIPLILASFGVIPETKSHFAVIGSIMEKLRYDSFHFILKSFIICFRVTQDGLYHLLSTPGLSARKGETVRIIHIIQQSFISF